MPNLGQNLWFFLFRVTLKIDRWYWKTIGHLFYATSSRVHHFVAIGEFKVKLLSGNAQFGSKSTIFLPCDLEICWVTLKTIQYLSWARSSFVHHFIIICELKLEFGPETAKLGFDLREPDLWPWPFARTSLLSLVITPEIFMMIRWWEHCEKGVTDGRTYERTEPFIEQLKITSMGTGRMITLDLNIMQTRFLQI